MIGSKPTTLKELELELVRRHQPATKGDVKAILKKISRIQGKLEELEDRKPKYTPTKSSHKVCVTKRYNDGYAPPAGQLAVWEFFSKDVQEHIENYVVAQYGDMPNDQISNYDLDEYRTNLNRYVGRIGRGARGKEEALRDCLKIAHYASRLYDFLLSEERE